jgi:hypothetical protein
MPTSSYQATLNPQDLQNIYNLVPSAQSGQLYVFLGPPQLIGSIALELVHRFGALGELRLLLGGNRFSLETLPLILGDQVHGIYDVLKRMWVSRGETCYQLLDALQRTPNQPEPFILTDMLRTFYEDGLSDIEVQRVFNDCIKELQRLCQTAPVVVSAAFGEERPQLLSQLREQASQLVEVQPLLKLNQPIQPELLND